MARRNKKISVVAEIFLAASLALALPTGAQTQESHDAAQKAQGLLAPGDAAVTGFSGAPQPIQIPAGVDPAEKTFIDLDGPSLRVFDLQDLRGAALAQFVQTPKPFTVRAGQIGQVFGVTLDSATPPNIYVAASSAYGLPIIVTGTDGQSVHVRAGRPGAQFMPGLWGAAALGGGPGSIWKIDGASGVVSLFANVGYNGRKNSGPALGGLAFDPQSQSLYVADRESGFIHQFGPDGVERGRYDHGVNARAANAMEPVPFDPSRSLDVVSPQFDSSDPATWHYAPPERLVFAVAVAARRLYYSVAADQQIWSVGLAPDGAFMADPRPEIVVPPAAGPTEISKIAFDEQGRMFLAERPAPTGAFDFARLSQEGVGRVLRYERFVSANGGPPQWRPLPEEYAIGFPRELRNANGGLAISYLYDSKGRIEHRSCGGFLWVTGEDLRASADPVLTARLRDWGPEHVQGLQGFESWRIRRDHEPPLHAYFTDYDDHFDDLSARGHLGDIAILRTCGLAAMWGRDVWGESGGPPPVFGFPPGGPNSPPKPPPPPKCTLLGACPPPPVCSPPLCPPCRPDERRGRDGQCVPISCPAPGALIGGNCCQPASLATAACSRCPSGDVPVGPSHFCCPSGQVYSGANGASACCSGQVVNGRCQPGTPNNPGAPQCQPGQTPPCCGAGYVQTGNICCLSGQATANGICCPAGETPAGDQCLPIHFTPPGPSCCAAGQTQTMNGQCCATANITTQGICCPVPVDPSNPGACPEQIQSIIKCAPGYTKMPNGSCCRNGLVSRDGKSCGALLPLLPAPRTPVLPPRSCAARGNYVGDPHHAGRCIPCARGRLANEDHTACLRKPRGHVPPPVATCSAYGARFIRNPRNPRACIVCPRGEIANRSHTGCIAPHRYGPIYGPPIYAPGPYYPAPGRPPRFFGPRPRGFFPGAGVRGGAFVPR